MSQPLRRAIAVAAVLFWMMVAPGSAQRQGISERPLSETTNASPRRLAVIGAGGLVHGVETLEKSLEYYQKVFGFELIGSVPETPIFDIHIQALTNHGGVLHRSATLKIPGSTMNLLLFEGTNGQPGTRASPRQATARPIDPGGAVLGLRVPSIASTFTSIESSHQADVVSAGGKPAGKRLFARNRDGFVTEIIQSDGREGSAGSNADAASIALTAGDDAGGKIRFYTDVLGFELKTGDWEAGKDVMNAVGAEMGMVRRSQGEIPGTKIHFEIDEYSGIPQKRAYYYYNSIPGAVSLQLLVRDIDEMVKVLRAAQVRIVTTGQQPVPLDHSRTLLIRDPDGVFIQLIERDQD